MWLVLLCVLALAVLAFVARDQGWLLPRDRSARARVVLITGSTEGIGLAMAKEFARLGDTVVVSSRSELKVTRAIAAVQAVARVPERVFGHAADVSAPEHCAALVAFTVQRCGRVDIVVCNAGVTYAEHKPLVDSTLSDIQQVLSVNLIGTLLTAQAAIRVMGEQPGGGNVVLMDGAGSNGMATPSFLAYGASKAALPQVATTLRAELSGTDVRVNVISPGMVLTRLLLGYGHKRALSALRAFNILAETPATVAGWLVPVVRGMRGSGVYARYLTALGVVGRFATAWTRRGRFFDAAGDMVTGLQRELE